MSKPQAFDLLRHRAEERLSGGRFKPALLEVDTRKLLHELQVHQVELELQNEELRAAQAEIEARHQQDREEAERSHQAKAHFLAHASQELVTPLAQISMLAQFLADNLEGNLNPRQADYAASIAQTCNQLRHLVDDVVDMAAMEAGELTVDMGPIPIPDLLQDIQRQFRESARRKGLSFQVEIDADVPAAVTTDPRRLQQILRSLLGNAVKYTAEGDIVLRVRLHPQGVAFDVADTGIGIAAALRPALFDFIRPAPEPALSAYPSTGLGLPVVRQIAERLGGGISVASKPGAGSTFTVFLPGAA